ncbi:MAG: ankyrin repeat domain-containing protein [Gemmatimonadota bacterium]
MSANVPGDVRARFLEAAVWHGRLEPAEAILAQYPALRTSDVFTASILGDHALVRQLLAADASNVSKKDGPYDTEPLVYLALSKYLRLDKARTSEFVQTAAVLLDAGADPNAGFTLDGEFESALYGAAGVAHNAELTQLLLDRGAVPDGEVCYHAAEEYDLGAMQALVRSGKVDDEGLTLLLLRKIDWHDEAGVKWLLAQGVSPDRIGSFGFTALTHALRRDNSLAIIDALLDHGADPLALHDGKSGVARAARAGRGDVLESLQERGVSVALDGIDALLAACALGESARVQTMAHDKPGLVKELLAVGGKLLGTFVGTDNRLGVRQLLDLGVPVEALWEEGDGYFGVAPNSMAIHVAAWLARHDLVETLIDRGSPVNVRDGKGRTPLQLAVKATVDSYWTERRKPDSVRALIAAGASVEGVEYPSGYAAVDAILASNGVESA